MKGYTDREQSKKLTKILPIESADMYYSKYDTIHANTLYGSCDAEDFNIREYIPCWSLSALLGVLPRFIEFKGDKYYLRFMKEYVEYANDEVSITGRCLHTTGNNNLVDACYEMILKLHELKML